MKIGVDLDEVLAQFLKAFLAYHNDTYGTNCRVEEAFSYDFREVRGGTRESIIDEVHAFHKTEYFTNIEPIPGALEVLQRLKKDHDLYIITSRQDSVQQQTKDRVQKHFPNIFTDLYFMNHFSSTGSEKSKGDICDDLGIDIMIDDSVKYSEDCARGSRKVLLYNQPRNQSKPLSPNIQRVQNRKEINYLI